MVPARERGAILGKRKRGPKLSGRATMVVKPRVSSPRVWSMSACRTFRAFSLRNCPRLGKADQGRQARHCDAGSRNAGRHRVYRRHSAREVSDDRAAQMVLQNDGKKLDEKAEEMSKKYISELREKARIVTR